MRKNREVKRYTAALKKAVIRELSRVRGYGCVTLQSSGSHADMTYETFLVSIDAVCEAFENAPWFDVKDFSDLRRLGLGVEDAMLMATGGVNTQKGLIFLHTILIYAWLNNAKWGECDFIADLCKELIKDYDKAPKAIESRRQNLNDIRGIALDGFKEIFTLADKLNECDMSDDLLTVLLISKTDDSTTVSRSSVEKLRELQSFAGEIISNVESGDAYYIYDAIKLDREYLDHNISSGGVSDVFTTIRTLQFLRRESLW